MQTRLVFPSTFLWNRISQAFSLLLFESLRNHDLQTQISMGINVELWWYRHICQKDETRKVKKIETKVTAKCLQKRKKDFWEWVFHRRSQHFGESQNHGQVQRPMAVLLKSLYTKGWMKQSTKKKYNLIFRIV